jgi:hypothetical protein
MKPVYQLSMFRYGAVAPMPVECNDPQEHPLDVCSTSIARDSSSLTI